jgi:hypothetical protein
LARGDDRDVAAVSGLHVRVDRLTVEFDAPGEHAHRMETITRRALALLEELAPAQLVRLRARRTSLSLPVLSPDQVTVDFTVDADEEIARRLARSWLDALAALP